MSDSAIRYVVTTVHGTYAKHATWVGWPKSKLEQALTKRFGASVVVRPRGWSGANNPAARAEGRDLLRDHLLGLLGTYPEASHYIVAHSHGGNVVLYALCDEALRDRIAGVACLATPFLVSRPRVLGSEDVTTQIIGAVVSLGVVSTILAVSWLDAFHPAWPKEPMIFVLVLFLLGIVGSLNIWQRYGERLQPELQLAKLSPERLLIIRAPGDEASAALLFFQFVSELSVRLYVLLYQLRERFLRLLNRWSGHPFWLLAASVGGFVFFLVLIFGAAALKMLEGVSLGVAVAFLWLCVVVPALTLIGGIIDEAWPIEAAAFPFQFVVGGSLFATIIVLSLTLLPFGWQVAKSNILLDITAETTPPGTWEVNLIEPSRSQDQTGDTPPLEHSVVYEDEGALTPICEWIARTEKGSQADG